MPCLGNAITARYSALQFGNFLVEADIRCSGLSQVWHSLGSDTGRAVVGQWV